MEIMPEDTSTIIMLPMEIRSAETILQYGRLLHLRHKSGFQIIMVPVGIIRNRYIPIIITGM